MMAAESQTPLYITLSGLPLRVQLAWPFRHSGSGADFYVLHGDVHLEGREGLHCLVSVQMTLILKQALPSLEQEDVEGPVVNTLRKETDRKQFEFVKSPKRVPVPFSSRQYNPVNQQWAFGHATDQQIADLLRRKVYWHTKAAASRVWICDPVDAQYVGRPLGDLMHAASRLSTWLQLDGEYATATPALIADASKIEAEMRAAFEALEKKHAFERG